MTRFAPSLLAADFAELARALELCEQSGADLLHLDVMDGHFVPNLTFGPPLIRALRGRTRVPFDVHLMIEEPGRWVEAYRDAGADRISVHVEAEVHLRRTLARIRELGASAGVAINPATSLALLEEALVHADFVLVMSVDPGFGGQAFQPTALERIRRLRQMIEQRDLTVDISVDGGVAPDNAGELVAAGADTLVAGSAFFRAGDPVAVARRLRGAPEVKECPVG